MNNIVPQDFNPEPKEPNPWLRLLGKVSYAVIGIILALLFISYFVPGNSLVSYFEGRAASATIDSNNAIALKNGGRVIVDAAVYEQLLTVFAAEQEHEFKVCLEGSKEGRNYVITGLSMPHIYGQTVFSVSAASCGNDTLIPLHSHPFRRCIPSQQDLRSQAAFKQVRPDSIGGLICEKNRFTFFG